MSIAPLGTGLGFASVGDGNRAMKDKIRPVTLFSQATEVRSVSQGIFDKGERRVVLCFVAESLNAIQTVQSGEVP
jgi:hypothetical protein